VIKRCWEAGAIIAGSLVALLATLRGHIAVFEQRIDELVRSHPGGASLWV